jgi:hypothetical protein
MEAQEIELEDGVIALPEGTTQVQITCGKLRMEAWKRGVAPDDPQPWTALWMTTSLKDALPAHLQAICRGATAQSVIEQALAEQTNTNAVPEPAAGWG